MATFRNTHFLRQLNISEIRIHATVDGKSQTGVVCEVTGPHSQPCPRWNLGNEWPGSGKSHPSVCSIPFSWEEVQIQKSTLTQEEKLPHRWLLYYAQEPMVSRELVLWCAGKAASLPCLPIVVKLIDGLRFQRQKPQKSRSWCGIPVCLLVSVSFWSNRFPHKHSHVWLIPLTPISLPSPSHTRYLPNPVFQLLLLYHICSITLPSPPPPRFFPTPTYPSFAHFLLDTDI
jgi:hypothetical protein